MASRCFDPSSLLPLRDPVRFLHHRRPHHLHHHLHLHLHLHGRRRPRLLPFSDPELLRTTTGSALPQHTLHAAAYPTPASSSDPAPRKYRNTDGIVIVDHGSRRAQSNAMIEAFVDMFKQETGHLNVEPAHMELANPTIKEAFAKVIENGATRVIISPYFLSPGRHWDKDIPALASEAARDHPHIPYIVTAPIGLHPLMVDILEDRINYCLSHVSGEASECNMCMGTGRCKLLESS